MKNADMFRAAFTRDIPTRSHNSKQKAYRVTETGPGSIVPWFNFYRKGEIAPLH
jgi:hypothetical protein